MKPSQDIAQLIAIMAQLRDPETGCAWDIEQTFTSISPYTIEEAYEVADAIERNDMADLADELGDLLLQVVFHARMAEELGAFAFGDVVEAITTKMIRRHPHVFGDERTRSRIMAKGQWERIKQEEKRAKASRNEHKPKSEASLLGDVPRALPALIRAIKLQKQAATIGFDWETAPPILAKIREETGELADAMAMEDRAHIEEEFGDLLFAMVNLGRHLDLEPEAALSKASQKFANRFRFIERTIEEEGKQLGEVSLDDMEAIWQRAKINEKNEKAE